VVANSRFAVAVHAATTLAYRQARGAEYVSSEELAASVRTNPVVVRRIIRALARAGVVTTKEGTGGGARLARPPRRIPLLRIYQAVEDNGRVLTHHPNRPNPACRVSCGIKGALAPVFGAVDDAVARTLGAVTLADVLDRI
jgi:Rrf2 family protein